MRTKIILTLMGMLMLALIAALGFAQPTDRSAKSPPPIGLAETQLIFVVRHADTTPKSGNNPNLNVEGQLRALNLASMIQDEQLGAIYVTNTNRSVQTAAPASAASGIPTTFYAPLDAVGLANTIRSTNSTTATLVIAHSNTVPDIIAALGGPSFDDLDEDSFDHFYAVVLKDGRHVRTVQLRY